MVDKGIKYKGFSFLPLNLRGKKQMSLKLHGPRFNRKYKEICAATITT